jgi:hypothetical protein
MCYFENMVHVKTLISFSAIMREEKQCRKNNNMQHLMLSITVGGAMWRSHIAPFAEEKRPLINNAHQTLSLILNLSSPGVPWHQSQGSVGSYGTRNVIEVIESWFWELPTDCPVLCLCLSSILRGIPFSWGIRLALPFLPMSCF